PSVPGRSLRGPWPRMLLGFGFRVAGGVGADVTERTLPAGHVRRPRLEVALPDLSGDLADNLFRARRFLGHRTLAATEARLQEAQFHPIRQAADRAQVRQRIDVELETLLRALLRLVRIVHRPRLEVEDGDALLALDHEVVPALHLRAVHEERELLLDP